MKKSFGLLLFICLFFFNSAFEMTDEQGNTFLHLAARDGLYKMAEELIKKGANIFIKNKAGRKPYLYIPAWSKDIDRLEKILKPFNP